MPRVAWHAIVMAAVALAAVSPPVARSESAGGFLLAAVFR
jgi:hypothetical protein